MDGRNILNLNRDDATGFRLDTLTTCKQFATPSVQGKEILTTRTYFVNKYNSNLQTTSYYFSSTSTTQEACVGVVKAIPMHCKNPTQHIQDLWMLSNVVELQPVFYNFAGATPSSSDGTCLSCPSGGTALSPHSGSTALSPYSGDRPPSCPSGSTPLSLPSGGTALSPHSGGTALSPHSGGTALSPHLVNTPLSGPSDGMRISSPSGGTLSPSSLTHGMYFSLFSYMHTHTYTHEHTHAGTSDGTDSLFPKDIDCIRVDGASDEGPSHHEVQFWWTEWHMLNNKVATIVEQWLFIPK